MSLSGSQRTRIGPVQVSHAYLGFTAKAAFTGTLLGQGGTLILVSASSSLISLDKTQVIDISGSSSLVNVDSDKQW